MYAHTAGASLLAIAAAACGGLASGTDGGAKDGSTNSDSPLGDSTLGDQLISTHYGGPPPIDAGFEIGMGSDALETGSFDASMPDAPRPFDAMCCAPYGAPFPPD